jgi:hypothetical protein
MLASRWLIELRAAHFVEVHDVLILVDAELVAHRALGGSGNGAKRPT